MNHPLLNHLDKISPSIPRSRYWVVCCSRNRKGEQQFAFPEAGDLHYIRHAAAVTRAKKIKKGLTAGTVFVYDTQRRQLVYEAKK